MSRLTRMSDIPVRTAQFPLYDTLRQGNASTISSAVNPMFTQPIGANADGFTTAPYKTRAECNLSGAGLPLGQAYRITHIGIYCRVAANSDPSATAEGISATIDVSAIMRNTVLEYQAGAELQILGPCEFWPSGGGVNTQMVATDGANTSGVMGYANPTNNGGPIRALDVPIILRDGQRFAFNLNLVRDITTQQASLNYDTSVFLWGTSFQEVQG
jgi:hypothetical protein